MREMLRLVPELIAAGASEDDLLAVLREDDGTIGGIGAHARGPAAEDG